MTISNNFTEHKIKDIFIKIHNLKISNLNLKIIRLKGV